MKDTIFISHATPEDNEFTIWLASRLELMGYKVWIDKNELLGGEKFWETIESAIKKDAVKFLLVYSKNICYKDSDKEIKAGILKEINFANEVIASDPSLKDFFTILHMDDSGYDLFPGAQDLNQISFQKNWADGLSILVKKLNRDQVPSSSSNSDEAANWYLANYIIKNPIIEKKELYYTTWWVTNSLPPEFYILRYSNETQAQAVAGLNKDIPLVQNANCITTFCRALKNTFEDSFGINAIEPEDTFELKINDLTNGFDSASFPNHRDAENHFKKLFKRILHLYFRKLNMKWYTLASKNLAYFHTYSSLPTTKTSFKYPFQPNARPKSKQLFGKHLQVGKWHYAISVKPSTSPFIGFDMKPHLIFTKDGFEPIDDKGIQHSNRRKKGKRMFNEEWRDLLLAFLNSICVNDSIVLETGIDEPIVMKSMVETFWSDYGYYDPKDLKRQELFVEEERDQTDDE